MDLTSAMVPSCTLSTETLAGLNIHAIPCLPRSEYMSTSPSLLSSTGTSPSRSGYMSTSPSLLPSAGSSPSTYMSISPSLLPSTDGSPSLPKAAKRRALEVAMVPSSNPTKRGKIARSRSASAGLAGRHQSMDPSAAGNPSGLLDEYGIPITYTPTTHRISKAKKGKRVHVCEYGCGKIFSRNEHKKRHEASHRSEPLFQCYVEDCRKPFQRADLLHRHLERQHRLPSAENGGGRYERSSSTLSSDLSLSSGVSPAPVAIPQLIVSPNAMYSVSLPAPGLHGIDSTLAYPHPQFAYGSSYPMPFEMAMYSSDFSGYSPVSSVASPDECLQSYLPHYGRPRATSTPLAQPYVTSMLSSSWPGGSANYHFL